MFSQAQRLNDISEPQTIRMAKLSRAMAAEGKDIVDLSLGEPDFSTPQFIKDAATAAMADGYTKYPPVAGYPELREAICHKLLRDNNLQYTSDQIIVSTGAKQAIDNLIFTLLNEGDEAIIPTPYWVSYSSLVEMAGGKCVFIPGAEANDFKITAEQLAAAITPKTKLLIYSSPCNPSGAVYNQQELASLVEVLEKHPNIYVISDEIYEYINYMGAHHSIASFPSIKERVAIVNGFSKGFAMTGWRLGYLAATADWARACEKYQAQITSGSNSITQRAAITALKSDLSETQAMVAAYEERRNFVLAALRSMPGVSIVEPHGAFYMFPNISSFFGKSYSGHTIKSPMDMSMYLLEVAHVTTVSGEAFGSNTCIRMSIAASMTKLQEGMKRMKEALANLA